MSSLAGYAWRFEGTTIHSLGCAMYKADAQNQNLRHVATVSSVATTRNRVKKAAACRAVANSYGKHARGSSQGVSHSWLHCVLSTSARSSGICLLVSAITGFGNCKHEYRGGSLVTGLWSEFESHLHWVLVRSCAPRTATATAWPICDSKLQKAPNKSQHRFLCRKYSRTLASDHLASS